MAPVHLVEMVGSETMFGEIGAKNVTFIVDTSGSMYPYLPAVKDHLHAVLLARAHRVKDSMFNVVGFASAVTPWADRMVRCMPQTVRVAGDWINRLACSDGTNSLDALATAFADPVCEAVYLVSDGLPDQQPSEILQRIALVSEGRPVHAIYLSGGVYHEVAAKEFLESLAVQTLGTFHVISITTKGAIERVEEIVTSDHSPLRIGNPVYRKANEAQPIPLTTLDNPPVIETAVYNVEGGVPGSSIKTTLDHPPESTTLTYKAEEPSRPVKYCSVTTSMDHNPVPETVLVRESLAPRTIVKTQATTAWETMRTQPVPIQPMVLPSKPAVELFEGMKVVARRERDGYYCPATIKEKLSAMRSFLVIFDKDPSSAKSGQHLLQETSIHDIKALNHAMRHPVVPGDKVLAPWEKSGYRFAPGIVLDGIEGRSTGCGADSEHLVVSFFNGKTAKVAKQTAVWIPHTEYERHKVEIQMPLTARHYVVNAYDYDRTYEQSRPSGYTVPVNAQSEYSPQVVGLPVLQQQRVGPGSTMYVPVVMAQGGGSRVRQSAVLSEDMDTLIPGTDMTRNELSLKVMQQLVENKMLTADVAGDVKSAIKRRQRKKDKRARKSTLRKSVSFKSDDLQGLDSGLSSMRTDLDSEGETEEEEVTEEDELEKEVEEMKKKIAKSKNDFYSLIDTGMQTMSLTDTAVGTDSSLLYNRIPSRPKSAHALSSGRRPDWKYWRRMQQPRSTHHELVGRYRESVPVEATDDPKLQKPRQPAFVFEDKHVYQPVERSSLLAPFADDAPVKSDKAMVEWEMRRPRPRTAHVGPFRDTALEAPQEARLQATCNEPQSYVDQTVINRGSVFTPVNRNQVRSDRAMIEWERKQPRPPPPPAQAPAKPVSKAVGTRDQVREAKERAYIEYRQKQTIQREYTWYMKEQQEHKMKEAHDERCRQFAAEVTRRDVQRQKDSEAKMQNVQDAKKAVTESVTGRQKSYAVHSDSREQRRIEALRARNQARLDSEQQRVQERTEIARNREEGRRQRNEERSHQHVDRLCERREQEAARDLQMRSKELDRRAHFRDIERRNQEHKDVRIAMRDQRNEEYRSQVLP